MWKNKIQIFIALSLFPLWLLAQNNKASISLSKDSIRLGDRLEMTLLVPADNPEACVFPEFPADTVAEHVSVLKKDSLVFDDNKKLASKTYVISSYVPGQHTIPQQTVLYIENNDTLKYISDSLVFDAKSSFVLDTLPRDTVYAKSNGVVFFGRANFTEQIEQQIPDSVRQSMSEDSLNLLKQQMYQTMVGQFSGQVFRTSGLRSEKDILQMVQASPKRLFVVTDKSIRETHRIPGAYDTVFVQETDTVLSKQPLFTSYQIEDIVDDYYKTAFNVTELFYYVWKFIKTNWWWLLASLVLLLALGYYFLFYRKNKKLFTTKEKVQEPAHVIAFRELERIRNEKLWLKNQVKSYYTDLTDTIRHYFENRYGLSAMEQTSAEILESLKDTDYLTEDLMWKLREVLERADFVKFAKSMPLPDENERSLQHIYSIVEQTQVVPDLFDEGAESEMEQEVKPIKE